MEATNKIRNFLSSQNLYTGIRMTAAALIPSLILYHYNLLGAMIILPLGAMFTGLTDSPGPVRHRINGLVTGMLVNFAVIIISGSLHANVWLVTPAIVFFGMLLSLIAVYGSRASSIGLVALIVFIFNIDGHLAGHMNVLKEALLFTAGGVWYTILSLLLHTLRPYKMIQQLVGNHIIELANYLEVKAKFYEDNPDYAELQNLLMQSQITIRQEQEELREILYKTRRIVAETSVRGRVLMSIFLDSIDLLERIMTSQYDYAVLHKKFEKDGILETIAAQLQILAADLHDIGLALQRGMPSQNSIDLDALQRKTMDAFIVLRKENINTKTIEDFIALRQIIYSLQDITERIKRLHRSTRYDKMISREYRNDVELEKFTSHTEMDPKLLLNNLTLKSSNFRHAVRLTVALLVGYFISLFYPLGHSYWILLTIAVIIKPAYSITRQRNLQRVAGTLAGAAVGFLIIYLIKDTTALFILLIITMVLAYSLLRINYFISSAFITLYLLISLGFLGPSGFHQALSDRVADTIIGSVIAFIMAAWVLPVWEHEQIDRLIKEALEANRKYFNVVACMFTGEQVNVTFYKLYRKNAFVALANLSDTFQRMLSEPKNKQVKMEHYHQFVATNHTLTSYIASLSYYAQRNAHKYASDEFVPIIKQINKQFQIAAEALEHHQTVAASQIKPAIPVSKKVNELLVLRRHEVASGRAELETTVRKTLSDLKTIYDQFEMISMVVVDEVRILEKLAA
ncbi:FUSC family protein [Ilyomonas limi]|uniref:FUSC family protein n=1 Tax=Ilyomonas limi TaxID=2575867 RepID=A0A4U3KZA8_9BACT|nr:FUSC family membrane protein [Ilyomonas limi]TKK67229.1 FUSC family protein [Ilyomonas limi]